MAKQLTKGELQEKIYQFKNPTSSWARRRLKNLQRELQRLEDKEVVVALSTTR